MATITKTIGTAARDYATITLWEAALGGAAGGGGNDAVGNCYADGDFTEKVVINDATPDSITLQAAAGQIHDGTEGTGVYVEDNTGGTWATLNFSTTIPITVIGLEVSGLATNTQFAFRTTSSGDVDVLRCLGYDCYSFGDEAASTSSVNILNCITYELEYHGVHGDSGDDTLWQVLNCTVVRNPDLDAANSTTGVRYAIVKNTIAMHFGPTSGHADFLNTGAGSDYCLSHDTSAPGANSVKSKAANNQFVSTVAGSEDLHLKAGADALDVGTDLGTTPSGVEIDIDGRDRDAQGDTWDIGADEQEAAAGLSIPIAMRHYLQMQGAG